MDNRKKRNIIIGVLVLMLIFLLFSGCGLFGPEEVREPIDPPQFVQTGLNVEDLDLAFDEEALSDSGLIPMVLYLLDHNNYVVPMTMMIPNTEGIATQVLNYMVKGGPVEEMLPIGFTPLLPEGTTVNIDIQNGLAIVDFSKEFSNYEATDERKIVEGVTWALTEFPTVDRVRFWINGTPLETMPKAGTPIELPLTRDIGINLEMTAQSVPGKTSAVTVYFEGETTIGDMQYFVPVTRLIPRTTDLVKATLQELISGPQLGSGLATSIRPSVEVIDATVSNGIVIADFNEELLGYTEYGGVSVRGLESVVLSLATTTEAERVQILVEGQAGVATESVDFSQPVTAPKKINTYSY